ncbi:MAG TPA: late competence development ComFB family protein, partial [Spirochaetia bacterium]
MSERREPVLRIGEILVKSGALRREQLGLLLDEQRESAAAGVHSRLGEIAVRKGWVDADEVFVALKEQALAAIDRTDVGDIVLAFGWITPSQLEEARRRCARSAETVEEALAALCACSPEKLRIAGVLVTIRTEGLVRRLTGSSFVPYNVMELIVGEETSAAIREDRLCACSQCWSNTFALALNAMPARYVSDHGMLLDFYRRFREEYGELAREQVRAALRQVRSNPKASCLSRFSDGGLDGEDRRGRLVEIPVRVSHRHVHLNPAAM